MQVTTMVDEMMAGYNKFDYTAFSKNLTGAMKLVIDEGIVKKFCADSADTPGQF
jgi:hypothetical protein